MSDFSRRRERTSALRLRFGIRLCRANLRLRPGDRRLALGAGEPSRAVGEGAQRRHRAFAARFGLREAGRQRARSGLRPARPLGQQPGAVARLGDPAAQLRDPGRRPSEVAAQAGQLRQRPRFAARRQQRARLAQRLHRLGDLRRADHRLDAGLRRDPVLPAAQGREPVGFGDGAVFGRRDDDERRVVAGPDRALDQFEVLPRRLVVGELRLARRPGLQPDGRHGEDQQHEADRQRHRERAGAAPRRPPSSAASCPRRAPGRFASGRRSGPAGSGPRGRRPRRRAR